MKNGDNGKTATGVFWRAARRFPAAFLLAAAYAVLVCCMNDKERVFGVNLQCIAMPMLAWAGLSVVLGLCGERWRWKRWIRLSLQAAVLLATAASLAEYLVFDALVGHFIYSQPQYRDTYFWISRSLAALGTWLLAAWALAGRQARPEDAAPRAAVAFATGLAAFAGLALGLYAIELALVKLFGLPWRTVEWITKLIVGPALALGGWLAVALATREEPFEMPRAWRLLLRWVAVPVSLAFTGLLLVYFAVCVARMDLPRGQIVWFASLAACAWMALHLLLAAEPGCPTRAFVRWGGLAILPLTALQFVALGIRIGEYGLTPARLGGLLLASWIALFCLAAAVRPSATARWGFAAAAVLALLAGLSPWNISDMGIAAQVRRLDAFRARRDAGETFDAATQHAIWGTWNYVSDFGLQDGHWRRMYGFDKGDFRKEWGFGRVWEEGVGWKWVESGGAEAAETDRILESRYRADFRHDAPTPWPAMPGGEVRRCTFIDRDGRLVVGGDDADWTDALLDALYGDELPPGGALWAELEDGRRCLVYSLFVRTDAARTVVKHAHGEGWLFAPAPPVPAAPGTTPSTTPSPPPSSSNTP